MEYVKAGVCGNTWCARGRVGGDSGILKNEVTPSNFDYMVNEFFLFVCF